MTQVFHLLVMKISTTFTHRYAECVADQLLPFQHIVCTVLLFKGICKFYHAHGNT